MLATKIKYKFKTTSAMILEHMAFINDDHIPSSVGQYFAIRAFCAINRANNQLIGRYISFIAQTMELEAKLALHFLNPLINQRRRRENQARAHHFAQVIFFDDQSGLNGFAQTNFIGQNRVAVHFGQYAASSSQLIFFSINRRIFQRQQLIKPAFEGVMFGLFAHGPAIRRCDVTSQ